MSQQNPTITEATKYAKDWLKNGDMTKAFKAAFPNTKAKQKSIYERASLLHKHVKIHSRIAALTLAAKKSGEKRYAISVSELQKRLSQVMDAGLKKKKDAQGNKISNNLSAVVSAIKEVNLMNGNHADTKGTIELKPGEGVSVEMRVTSDAKESGKAYEAMLNGNNE